MKNLYLGLCLKIRTSEPQIEITGFPEKTVVYFWLSQT